MHYIYVKDRFQGYPKNYSNFDFFIEKIMQKRNNKVIKDYRSGFLICLAILVAGSLIEVLTKEQGVSIPSWPMNVFVGLSFAFILVFVHFFYGELKEVKFLSRVPASVSAILLFTFLTLILGLTKQNQPDASAFMKITGFSHVQSSYTFLFAGMYLLTTLGLVILRRVNKFNYRNAGFFLNHFGLWLIVLAGSLGAGDLKRLYIYVYEGETVNYAFNSENQGFPLPFTVELKDFSIDYFPPKLAFVEKDSLRFPEGIENNMLMIEDDMSVTIAGWNVHIEKWYPSALPDSNGIFIPSNDTSAVPVAYLKAENALTGNVKAGMISSGGIMRYPKYLTLDENYALAMAPPEPRIYRSDVIVREMSGNEEEHELLVNKPISIEGWKLYQLSYDEEMGQWSRLSIIEAIRDPWLIVIYIGIFMVIGGSLYLFTIGKKTEEA